LSTSLAAVHAHPALNTTNMTGYVTNATLTATASLVTEQFREPSVKCYSNHKGANLAIWVGMNLSGTNYLGGNGALASVGTSVVCASNNIPVYTAWYRVYPNAEVTLRAPTVIRSGNAVVLTLTYAKGNYTLNFTDTSKNWSDATTVAGTQGNIIEWIVSSTLPLVKFHDHKIDFKNFFGNLQSSGKNQYLDKLSFTCRFMMTALRGGTPLAEVNSIVGHSLYGVFWWGYG
jgi:hypothetical protein